MLQVHSVKKTLTVITNSGREAKGKEKEMNKAYCDIQEQCKILQEEKEHHESTQIKNNLLKGAIKEIRKTLVEIKPDSVKVFDIEEIINNLTELPMDLGV